MRIDRHHRSWAAYSALFLAAASLAYLYYVRTSPLGPRGGGAWGLWFGVIGSALMIAAGLLSARKAVPRLQRLGSAQFWLRGHIWLGLLSGPLILFHSGFRLGGPLEQVLMAVFAIVYFSGVLGVVLQTLIPRQMKSEVPHQPIFENIADAAKVLLARADLAVESVAGPLQAQREETGRPAELLARAYLQDIRPFLAAEAARPDTASAAASNYRAKLLFSELRLHMPSEPEPLHRAVEVLDAACREKRQILRFHRLQWWLHGWLLLHVPLSLALLVLGAAHVAFSFLWY